MTRSMTQQEYVMNLPADRLDLARLLLSQLLKIYGIEQPEVKGILMTLKTESQLVEMLFWLIDNNQVKRAQIMDKMLEIIGYQ